MLDENSGEGIPNVLLYNSDKSKRVITNLDGLVSLDDFVQNDIITFSHISYEEKSIILSCLLYTSPSPRDATLSRMPSSA